MAWTPPVHLNLDEAFFELIPKITQTDWTQFALVALRLDNSDVNNSKVNYQSDVRQQKIDMLNKWRSNVGPHATVENLFATLNHYLFPETQHRPEYWARMKQPSQNYAEGRSEEVPHPSAQAAPTSDALSQVSVEAVGDTVNGTSSYAQLCKNIREIDLENSSDDSSEDSLGIR